MNIKKGIEFGNRVLAQCHDFIPYFMKQAWPIDPCLFFSYIP